MFSSDLSSRRNRKLSLSTVTKPALCLIGGKVGRVCPCPAVWQIHKTICKALSDGGVMKRVNKCVLPPVQGTISWN